MNKYQQEHNFLSLSETCQALSISPTTLRKLRMQMGFPLPFKFGTRKLRWKRMEVEAWAAVHQENNGPSQDATLHHEQSEKVTETLTTLAAPYNQGPNVD